MLLEHRTFCGPDGLDASTSLPTVDDFATTLQSAGKELSAVSLDEADMERFVDLRPFMNPWPFTVVRWVMLSRFCSAVRLANLERITLAEPGDSADARVSTVPLNGRGKMAILSRVERAFRLADMECVCSGICPWSTRGMR